MEKIKADLATVQDKVKRSVHLIQSLNEESKRWELSKETFSSRYETLVRNRYSFANILN
jgi:dynein heavy chain 1